jgi:cell division septum initiation protein DivIVA
MSDRKTEPVQAFSKERNGYSRTQVDAFIEALTTQRINENEEHDAEIKRLFSENQDLKERLSAAEEALGNSKRELDSALELKETEIKAERELINARMGEKISAAEDAAKSIIAKAEAECDKMKADCRTKLDGDMAAAHEKAEKYCETVRHIALVYEEKQQLISSGLEQARRHLDDAVRNVDDIFKGEIK